MALVNSFYQNSSFSRYEIFLMEYLFIAKVQRPIFF
ncbi:MAG: hypothetical protein ACJARP_000978, partial [Vicingaceae bacterium]